jgi:signal transduction histidine kinase
MTPFIDQFINFLSIPQGSLIYSLVIGSLAFGAYQASLYASSRQVSIVAKRMQRGLLYLLLTQMVLFTISWLAWIGIIDSHTILPPLDRTIALFSLVLIIWLWAFPEPLPVADRLTIGLEIVILVAGTFSLFWWSGQSPNAAFNTSMLGAYAYYIGIILLMLGVILLLWRRPDAWGYGIAMLAILLAGYIAQFFIRQPAGDFPWLVRMGEMAAFTMLLALPRRLVTLQGINEVTGEEKSISTSTRMEAQFFQSMLDVINERAPQQYYQKLTQWVARYMDAEICLFMVPPRIGGQLILPVGYNLSKDQVIDGLTVDGHKMPSLLDAIQKGISLQIDGSAIYSEVRTLTSELGLVQTTHLLAVPLKPSEFGSLLGLLLLSKPAKPVWSQQDAFQLSEALKILSSNIPQTNDRSNLVALMEEAKKYHLAYDELKAQYDAQNAHAAGLASTIESQAALLLSHKKMQETINQLESRNQELENLLTKNRPSLEEVEQLRQELHAALEDLARIPNALSKSDQKMLELQLSAMKHLDELGQTELVTSIAQEFRQPLSSIKGYTDLLLEESVGILGAMQRKFLERVKASTERLGTLMNDLVEVLAIDGGTLDQTMDMVDLEAVVDEAVGEIIAQISEKNITMRVDLPVQLPTIKANKDALQQILANLLQNACLVTPEYGEIRLFARIEKKEDEPNYLMISVTDQGGGISKDDIPRIFSRHYKVENPSIQGIGDTGVGLSIVNSLVELHKGRIWVDTREGIGSTFSCVIPLPIDQPEYANPVAE